MYGGILVRLDGLESSAQHRRPCAIGQVGMRLTRIHAVMWPKFRIFYRDLGSSRVCICFGGILLLRLGRSELTRLYDESVAVRACFELTVHFVLFNPCKQRKSF